MRGQFGIAQKAGARLNKLVWQCLLLSCRDTLWTQSIICVGYLQDAHQSFSCVEEWVVGSSVLPLAGVGCQGLFLSLCWEGVLERAGSVHCMKWVFSQSAGAVAWF